MCDIGTAHPAFLDLFEHSFNRNIPIVTPEEVKNYKLIIFPGGEDINPGLYGQANTHSHFTQERDDIEIPILKECLKLGVKILGVCRGHQLINAILGGILVQDLSLIKSRHWGGHQLTVVQDGLIPQVFTRVNSAHHQGVIVPGRNLKITTIYDGVIESTESDSIISVQFHPEFMESSNFFGRIENWIHTK